MTQDDKGHYRKYQDIRFRADTLELIDKIVELTKQYEAQGYTLTVRQLHYQFVSRGWLPNTEKTYDRLQTTISNGRLAGLISWTAIEDRGRGLKGLRTQNSPAAAVAAARASYRIDLWAGQDWRPEVWVEKQALEGVIGGICNELRVDFYACKGYDSQSMSWEAGQRFADYVRRGQRPIVFHLGDHDPSGRDMTRDNRERLSMFAGVPVMVQRLALNLDQVDRYSPPPNPTKATDARAFGYGQYMEENFRDPQECWELDALDPPVIRQLVSDAVGRVRDEKVWDERLDQEVADKELMDEMIEMMGGAPEEN
jgi:hypothetical protein